MSDRFDIRQRTSTRMGVRYEAVDHTTGDPAILVRLGEAETGMRLNQEAFAAAEKILPELRHDSLVPVLVLERDEEGFFAACGTPGGEPLFDVVGNLGALSSPEVCAIALDVLSGMAALEAAGLRHGSPDPERIHVLRAADGTIRARLAEPALTSLEERNHAALPFGRDVRYIAPEELDGLPGDTRSDLYTAGASLFLAACGHAPVESMDAQELREAHAAGNIPLVRDLREDIQGTVAHWLQKMVSINPADRPPDAASALEWLRATLGLRGPAPAGGGLEPLPITADMLEPDEMIYDPGDPLPQDGYASAPGGSAPAATYVAPPPRHAPPPMQYSSAPVRTTRPVPAAKARRGFNPLPVLLVLFILGGGGFFWWQKSQENDAGRRSDSGTGTGTDSLIEMPKAAETGADKPKGTLVDPAATTPPAVKPGPPPIVMQPAAPPRPPQLIPVFTSDFNGTDPLRGLTATGGELSVIDAPSRWPGAEKVARFKVTGNGATLRLALPSDNRLTAVSQGLQLFFEAGIDEGGTVAAFKSVNVMLLPKTGPGVALDISITGGPLGLATAKDTALTALKPDESVGSMSALSKAPAQFLLILHHRSDGRLKLETQSGRARAKATVPAAAAAPADFSGGTLVFTLPKELGGLVIDNITLTALR